MPLIILLPVLLLLVAQGLTPELALFQLLPFPQTSYLALISVLLLALLLRQTEWLYWLGILATHYWLASSTNLTATEFANSLPLLSASLLLLLALIPKPSPFKILRSLIPVLLVIHSSEVSTMVSNSAFVST